MHPEAAMTRTIGGRRYSVATAVLLASDEYWDGHNWERGGRNQFLYRTPRHNYFTVTLTQWQGERDTLTPISREAALELYDTLPEHETEFELAFPGAPVEDA